MTVAMFRWLAIAPFTLLAAGCVATTGPGGYGPAAAGPAPYAYDDGGLDADYYQPFGLDYGGWGGGYDIAPYRSGYRGGYRGSFHDNGGHPGFGHGGGRTMPSIPTGHGGGGHSGGGRR